MRRRITTRSWRIVTVCAITCLAATAGAVAQSWNQFNDAATWQPTAFTVGRNDLLFLAHPSYGVYRTGSGNGLWELSTVRAGGVLSLATSPEGDIYASVTGALYMSPDNGTTWEELPTGGVSILSFAFDSLGVIYAGTNNGQVLRSADEGATWFTSSIIGSDKTQVLSLAVNSSGQLFAGVRGRSAQASSAGGVFRSTDGGRSWSDISSSSFDTPITAVSCATNGVIVVGRPDNTSQLGCSIFRSSSNGSRWDLIPMAKTTIRSFTTIAATSDGSFLTDYNGTIWRSTNGGLNWSATAPDVKENPWAIRPAGNGIWLAITSPSIYRSSDNGTTWSLIIERATDAVPTLFSTADVRSLATTRGATNGPLYVATAGLGLWKCVTNGSQATRLTGSLPGDTVLAVMTDRTGRIYAGGPLGAFRSSDGGTTWKRLVDSLHTTVRAFVQDSSSMLTVASDEGLYQSNDDGKAWRLLPSKLSNQMVRWMTADTYQRLIAGTDSGLYISEDQGATWNNITSGSGIERVNGMIETRDNRIIVGTSNGAIGLGADGIEWESITNGLPTEEVLTLAVTNDGHLFAGTAHGLYHSVDGGYTWHLSGSPFANLAVQSVVTNPATGSIFVGTNGGGAFWIQQFTSSVSLAELKPQPLNVQLAPNPVHDKAVLNFSLIERGNVVVEFFRTTGERVELATEGYYEPGIQNLPLDLSMLAAGSYLCRIRAGKVSVIQVIVVE
jgi:photosystem II stability/assembly factor-like uncharacterized protein